MAASVGRVVSGAAVLSEAILLVVEFSNVFVLHSYSKIRWKHSTGLKLLEYFLRPFEVWLGKQLTVADFWLFVMTYPAMEITVSNCH